MRVWQRDGAIKGLRHDGASWVLRYRTPDGRQRSMSLGLLSDLSAEEARRLAVDARQAVRAGRNPLDEKRARTDTGPTLGDLVDGFIASRKRTARPSTLVFYAALRKRLAAHEDRKARGLRHGDIARILDEIEGVPTRNRLLSLLRSAFTYGLQREVVLTNPAQAIHRSSEPSRERNLSDDEVAKLLATLDSYEVSGLENRQRIALGVRLLLFTGQRVREVLDADLGEFRFFREPEAVTRGRFLDTRDYDEHVIADWKIPASRRKTKKTHVVPLPVPLVALIKRHHGLSTEDMLAGKCSGPLCQLPAYRFDWCETLFKRVGLSEPWTLRDLRRTCSTKLADLEVNEALIAAIVGHAPAGITGRVYAKSPRTEERRKALERLYDEWVPPPLPPEHEEAVL